MSKAVSASSYFDDVTAFYRTEKGARHLEDAPDGARSEHVGSEVVILRAP